MKTVIILASTKKEAIQLAGLSAKYIGVYKYTKGKGNNFYEFEMPLTD
jgi:hypothetical protein